ncbi:MAG: thioredoxin domain-containing protein, partial [Gemmatimonadetes bacterium]|nr:thioredoxin domain-containing protein [Gemmatimonadota bacterium]
MANRLATETSPYLQQHSENPVDWFPWGDEALARARSEDKPILLSIGYSACHWCHVMERESFEDPETAALMNEKYVNIKVDREERPDLDSIYMRALQVSTGRGGWPLTAFLTPDGRFFYGGTYFPPAPRAGMPSFKQVLATIENAYRTRRQEIEEGSDKLLAVLAGIPPSETRSRGEGDEGLLHERGPGILDHAARYLAGQFDPAHGGFGPAPKFPQPDTLELLLRHFARSGDRRPLDMVLTTLRFMGRGGIRDHLGGGFHRYSVDDRWLAPHFEKMLYDNGLLARVYLHAFQITGDQEMRDVVTSTLDYVLADLRDPAGGFYSARDADSEGEEGLFYLWRPEEVRSVLEDAEADLFCRVYDVTDSGNFEGRNILHLSRSLDSLSETEGVSARELGGRLERSRDTLRTERDRREAPFRDEKVLVAWNSFVLRTLAEAAPALNRPDYLDAARTNAEFLLESLRDQGRLRRSWKNGQSKILAFLEDYAGLGNALLTLYEATLDPRWLAEGRELAGQVIDLFWEEEEGVFFDSPKDGEKLVVRPREAMDNATPSGNSLAIELLLRT